MAVSIEDRAWLDHLKELSSGNDYVAGFAKDLLKIHELFQRNPDATVEDIKKAVLS